MADFPVPGRGAWTLSGGLLPSTPGSASKVGYYGNAVLGEIPVGSAYIDETDTSHAAYCVYLGVRAIQGLVQATVDGWFGPHTTQAVQASQRHAGLDDDGVVGPLTMKALLTPVANECAASNDVPAAILGGVLKTESSLDPAAVGVNGKDHGLAQLNLGAHPDITVEQALDPEFSILNTAAELAHNHAIFAAGNTTHAMPRPDPWDLAIAAHNSPALARTWFTTGTAPIVVGRAFQIADYVNKVRAAW